MAPKLNIQIDFSVKECNMQVGLWPVVFLESLHVADFQLAVIRTFWNIAWIKINKRKWSTEVCPYQSVPSPIQFFCFAKSIYPCTVSHTNQSSLLIFKNILIDSKSFFFKSSPLYIVLGRIKRFYWYPSACIDYPRQQM